MQATLKNALTSIKTEIGTSSPVPNPDVVVPENTDFDGNVLEEYDYDEFEDTEPTEPQDNFDDKDEVQTVEDAVLDNEFKGGEQLGIAEVLAGEESLPVDGNAPVDADEVSESDADENGGFEVVDVTDAVDESVNPEIKLTKYQKKNSLNLKISVPYQVKMTRKNKLLQIKKLRNLKMFQATAK